MRANPPGFLVVAGGKSHIVPPEQIGEYLWPVKGGALSPPDVHHCWSVYGLRATGGKTIALSGCSWGRGTPAVAFPAYPAPKRLEKCGLRVHVRELNDLEPVFAEGPRDLDEFVERDGLGDIGAHPKFIGPHDIFLGF